MSKEQSEGRRWRLPGWRPIVRWGIAAVSVVLVARVGGLGWDEITEAIGLFGDLNPLLIAAVLGLEVAWAVTLAQTQRSAVLAVGGTLAHGHAQRISMAGFTLSRVVPGGGAAGGLFAMRELMRLGQPASVAVTSMTASWAASITSLAVLILGGLLVVAGAGEVPGVSVVPAGLVLGGLALVGCVILRALHSERLRRRLVARIARVVRRLPFNLDVAALERSFGAIDARQGDGRHLRHSFAWATVAWLCDAAALWLVFAAFGHRLSLTALIVGYGSANLLNSLPELTPGWLGVFETALSATYIGLGVPAGIAVAAVLVYRLASFWLPVAAGVAPAVRSLTAQRVTRMMPPAPQLHVPPRAQIVEVSA
jgi:uncharacterized protein (TIRG00374 family)